MSKIDRLKFKLYPIAQSDPACVDALKQENDARKALREAQQNLAQAIRKTTIYKAIEALASEPGDVSFDFDEMKIGIWNGRYDRWGVEFSEPKSASAHVDPKTLNALITGKLLTDEEKRGLLKSQGVDLDAFASKPTITA